MDIDVVHERLRRKLPRDWSVRFTIQRDAAFVSAVDPTGKEHPIDSDDSSVKNQLLEAAQLAQFMEQYGLTIQEIRMETKVKKERGGGAYVKSRGA